MCSFFSVLTTTLALGAATAAGAGLSSRPVRMVVPFPAAASPTLSWRVFAERMQTLLGQPIVVDPRAGAAPWWAR